MPKGKKFVEIPFEKYSNLVVIPIQLNHTLTLKFILDTGAETSILTEKIFGDFIGLQYVREITIQGPGLIDSLRAYVATGLTLTLPGGIEGSGFNMLVLKEDYLELHKNLGEAIYGIIGYDVFSRFVVKIDYDREILKLYDPDLYHHSLWERAIPVTIENAKPFIKLEIGQEEKKDTVKLMVDSGASHAILLDVDNTQDIHLPEKVITTTLGKGLGGEIPGFLGRMDKVGLDKFYFEDVLVSIPEDGAYIKAIKRGSRHGTFGGDLLNRFRVTFDYEHESIYLSRSRGYRRKFETNMSGMILAAEGENLDSLIVAKVNENTPAEKYGIKRGDQILRINGLNLSNSTLSEINALLRRKNSLKIRILLLRDGEKIKKIFRLKRLI